LSLVVEAFKELNIKVEALEKKIELQLLKEKEKEEREREREREKKPNRDRRCIKNMVNFPIPQGLPTC